MRKIALLIAAFALAIPMTLNIGSAHAAISVCRVDPVLTLSNGATLSLSGTINELAVNVYSVTYDIHLPSGVTVTSFNPPNDVFPEYVSWTSDNPSGVYSASTYVSDDSGAGVGMTEKVVNSSNNSKSQTVNGFANTYINTSVTN